METEGYDLGVKYRLPELAIGLEVEDVDDKALYKPFVIARVIAAEKHPPVSYTHLDVYKRQVRHGHP